VKLDHIGWCVEDVDTFERFWVSQLGYTKVRDDYLLEDLGWFFFRASHPVRICRYEHPTLPVVEVHCFHQFDTVEGGSKRFQQLGINHICLHTGGPGSRDELLGRLSDDVEKIVFDNPGGWKNIFLRDLESNWIELRETIDE
jgi:catechol 2,3-dioxygenase-like lactoylglutathione lyase family enzyme